MKVSIATILSVEGTGVLRRGPFYINDRDFAKDGDQAIAIKANEWIREQETEYGHRPVEILQVTWNAEHDITKLVKKLRSEIRDDLPF